MPFLPDHTITWHFPASFEVAYGITGLVNGMWVGGFTYTAFKPPKNFPKEMEVKDSGPSGNGCGKLYFICNCSFPHPPRGLHGPSHGHGISLPPVR